MFSIFSYIMSRVTHSEPGLPMPLLVGYFFTMPTLDHKYLTSCFQKNNAWRW